MRDIGNPGFSEYPQDDSDKGSEDEPLLYDDMGFPLYHGSSDEEAPEKYDAASKPELLPIFGVSETLSESVVEIRAENGGTRAETPYGRAKHPSRSLDVVVGKGGSIVEISDVAEMFSRATFGNIEVLRESALNPPIRLTTVSLGSTYDHPTHVMLEGLFQLDLDNSREASLKTLGTFSETFTASDGTSDGGYFFTRLARHQVRQEDMVWEASDPDPLGSGGHWVLPHDIRFDQPSSKDPVIYEPNATVFEAFHGGEIQGVMPNKFVVWIDWNSGTVRVLNHAVAGGETLVRPRDITGVPHHSSENGIYYQGDSFGALDYYMKNFTGVYLRVFDALQRAGRGPSDRPSQALKLAMGGTHLQRGPLHHKGDIDLALNQPGRLNQPWQPKALNQYSVN